MKSGIDLAQPDRVDGDPVSGHEASLSDAMREAGDELYVRLAELCDELGPGRDEIDFSDDDGWQAVAASLSRWKRASSPFPAPVPLPPQ